MKLIWGNNPELKFISNDEYYEGLGQLTNDCCKITYEENSVTGSYSDVYRIAFDCNPHKLILAFQDKLRTGNRINCDEYIVSVKLNDLALSTLIRLSITF